MTSKTGIRLAAAIAIGAALAGCSTTRAHKGAVIDTAVSQTIQPGVDNKESVQKMLGRPTYEAQFDKNTWYYVSRDTSQFGFTNPRLARQLVLVVNFDPAGNVTKFGYLGPRAVMAMNPTNRETPTLGRTRSFFEELFGNIGTVGGVNASNSGQ